MPSEDASATGVRQQRPSNRAGSMKRRRTDRTLAHTWSYGEHWMPKRCTRPASAWQRARRPSHACRPLPHLLAKRGKQTRDHPGCCANPALRNHAGAAVLCAAQVMTHHRTKVLHGRLFFKYGGYFARGEDACMPRFHDAHDGLWVSHTSRILSGDHSVRPWRHLCAVGRCTQ